MESAFYCNDTPFVDQVSLPSLAALWHGRVKLVGFESDVKSHFVISPRQGASHSQRFRLQWLPRRPHATLRPIGGHSHVQITGKRVK